MLGTIVKKIIGTKNDRELKRMGKLVETINSHGEALAQLSEADLQLKTREFRQAFQDGKTLDELLPEAFAVVREASTRVMGMRHFDVQMMGGIALHEGRISEMRTGEGKTLTATLAAYLNALSGEGVHVVTVNDYLAERDANWMRPLYEFLGLSVGVILSQQPTDEKRAAYASDITYGTNNEYGFDYLRDNMAFRLEDRVQRGLNYAIVDEVDSILIDESRTPLIISGPAADSSELYTAVNKLMPNLTAETEEQEGDYFVDEKQRQVELTETGHQKIEALLVSNALLEQGESLYAAHNLALLHHVHAALKAHALFHVDRDYIVQNNQIVIVDEHTGRTMPGRRWSEGIHQAIEAKEGVNIQQENQTLASTTFQNYFRLYPKLGGMTGTAMTEASEFDKIYKLGVVPIPTNRPMVRVDQPDLVYRTEEAKYEAVAEDIAEKHRTGQPILVGTVSVEKSDYLSALLKKKGVAHSVLNAKMHADEAKIVAMAGHKGAVTVATNMAGRGTDIMLGGNVEFLADAELRKQGLEPTGETAEAYDEAWPATLEKVKAQVKAEHDEVKELGGLYVLGTERHESRRIDNQLRGRSGRQGDPGESRFYLSLQDELMRLFKSDWVDRVLQVLRIPDDVPIENKRVTNAIANAQGQVEAQNFESRKNVLKYDDVMDRQRKVIYAERRQILEGADLEGQIRTFIDDVVTGYVTGATQEEDWEMEQLATALRQIFPVSLDLEAMAAAVDGAVNLDRDELIEALKADAHKAYDAREAELGEGAATVMALIAAEELGVEDVYENMRDKTPAYEELKAKHGLADEEIAYVADDVIDLPVMRRVGLPVAVADAAVEVLAAATRVTIRPGGHGAVRETVEFILPAQGKWNETLKSRFGL